MTSVAAPPIPEPQTRAPYENWRPPIIGVSVLAPVGATGLILACTPGGTPVLPTGAVENGHSPEEAAQAVLTGLPGGLPIRRQVAVSQVQMRRRKVITHLIVTAPLAAQDADLLIYRDVRAEVRVLSTDHAVAALPQKARTRVLLGLQALAIGAMVYVRDGEIQRIDSVPAHHSMPPGAMARVPESHRAHAAGRTRKGMA
ncbi:hypothetical protein [Streptomyces sp. SID1034]|uniref:hypothetical protein n=1 Tax=Streptomyces sp. SID1034 TaxID=2690248 RepID=UPI0013720F1B|nr:hypothetical protein [Streptomyces sp. SID1034]MYV90309.1 hypothetical protein [Streptomyces sp. SID1034]